MSSRAAGVRPAKSGTFPSWAMRSATSTVPAQPTGRPRDWVKNASLWGSAVEAHGHRRRREDRRARAIERRRVALAQGADARGAAEAVAWIADHVRRERAPVGAHRDLDRH